MNSPQNHISSALKCQSSRGWSVFKAVIAAATFCVFHAIGNAQVVENVTARLDNEQNGAIINYDLQSPDPDEFRVSLYYSLDYGATFQPATTSVTGDIGTAVTRGTGKAINWPNFVSDMRRFRGRQVIFRVAAQPGEDAYVVEFVDNMTTAAEGQGAANIVLKASRPFFGTIRYEVSALTNVMMGPVLNPDIGTLSGQVEMAGTSAVIAVPIMDDFDLEEPKALTLDLVYDESLGYTPGPNFRTMLILYDDDAFWNGVMRGTRAAEGEVPFRMALARRDGQLSATLVSSSNTARDSSAFPPGNWPVSSTWDGTVFSAESEAIPMPASSLFPDSQDLQRKLRLHADTRSSDTIVQFDKLIMGHSTDGATAQDCSGYLNMASPGGFLMIKEILPFVAPEPTIMPLPAELPRGGAGPVATDAVLELKGAQQ